MSGAVGVHGQGGADKDTINDSTYACNPYVIIECHSPTIGSDYSALAHPCVKASWGHL